MEEGDQFNENAFCKTNPNFPYILPALRLVLRSLDEVGSLGEVGFILSKKFFTKRSQDGCKIMKKPNEPKLNRSLII